MIKFSCMLCGEKLSVQDQLSGKRITCPKCNNTSVVPAESPRIRFECENCGRGIRVLQIHAGKKGQCPKCKSPVVVPSLKGDPGEDSGTVTVVCSMCNERVRAPKDSQERFTECPACGSNVETSLRGEPVESDSSIPPDTDQEQYEEEYEQEDEGPDRRLILAICVAAVVVVVGLIVLVAVILPSGSGPAGEPDVPPRQPVADTDSRPQPVASDTEPAGAFTLEPPRQDTLPKESVSSDQESLKQTKIAFVSNRDGNGEIYVMNADGSEQKNLTNSPAYDGYPCWSFDGKRIAFVSDSDGDGNGEIHVMNSDGSDKKKLTNDPTANLCPVWSPDGRMAFISLRDGNPEIYVMNADGSEQTRLTRNSLIDESPSWSPDGKEIAFLSKRDGIQDIYVMNADGSEQVNLTNSPAEDGFPCWSPDGKKIAFTSGDDRNTDIYVMNADGTGQENVTNSPAMDGFPCYSPDGKRIVFWSTRGGGVDIYAMGVDGSELENLTNSPSADMFPSWSPFLGSGFRSVKEPESRRDRLEITDADVRSQPVASKGSAAARNLDLKLRLQPGQKHNVRIVREDSSLLMGRGRQQHNVSYINATGLRFEVEQVDPNGVAWLKVTYLTIRETTKTAEGQREYDSTKPDTAERYLSGPTFSAMIGRSFVAKVAPGGRTLELEGVDEMFLAIAETIVDTRDEANRKIRARAMAKGPGERMKRSLEKADRERRESRDERVEAKRKSIERNYRSGADQVREVVANVIMPFPDRPVGIGDSWEAPTALLSMRALDLNDSTYTLRENRRSAAIVDVNMKIEMDDELTSGEDGGSGSARATLVGSYEGTIEIDVSNGWMLRKEVTLRCSGQMEIAPTERNPQGMTMPVSMESITTVEPIDTN